MNFQLPIMRNKKGFITIYLMMLLMACIATSEMLIESVNRYIDYKDYVEDLRVVNRAEVLAINRIKEKYKNKTIESEVLYLDGCTIKIEVGTSKTNLTITYNGIIRERCLKFDASKAIISEYH